jgi:hypothetical protein
MAFMADLLQMEGGFEEQLVLATMAIRQAE